MQILAHLNTPLHVRDPDQTLRIAEWQWTQHESVYHTEYRCTGADAEAGDENHKRGEAGIAPHPAKRMLQILRRIVHPMGDPRGALFFRFPCHIAKLSVRRRTSFLLSQTLS